MPKTLSCTVHLQESAVEDRTRELVVIGTEASPNPFDILAWRTQPSISAAICASVSRANSRDLTPSKGACASSGSGSRSRAPSLMIRRKIPIQYRPLETDPSSKLQRIAPRVFDTDHFGGRFLDFSVSIKRAQRRVANVRYGSKADIQRRSHLCPLSGVKRTFASYPLDVCL